MQVLSIAKKVNTGDAKKVNTGDAINFREMRQGLSK